MERALVGISMDAHPKKVQILVHFQYGNFSVVLEMTRIISTFTTVTLSVNHSAMDNSGHNKVTIFDSQCHSLFPQKHKEKKKHLNIVNTRA